MAVAQHLMYDANFYENGFRPTTVCGSKCVLKKLWNDTGSVRAHERRPADEHAPVDNQSMRRLSQQLYTPLVLDQIRLLKILPGSAGTTIRTTLELATLTHARRARLDTELPSKYIGYSTLSYSWGRPQFTCSIECNGVAFPITPNLRDALYRIRQDAEPLYIWVDAFCINQFDLHEKGNQVQMMFSIFQYSERTICWLGESQPRYEGLLSILSLDKPSFVKIHQDRNADSHCHAIQKAVAKRLVDFINGNRWFRRTWVRQEVFVARQTDILCGTVFFTFDMLVYLSEGLTQHLIPTFGTLVRDALEGKGVHPKNQDWFILAMTNSAGFEATDDHDRVYALQNMAEPDVAAEDRLIPHIKYGQEVAETYARFMKSFMMRDRGYRILSVFETRFGRDDDRIPSWVLDFRTNQARFLLEYKPVFDQKLEPDETWRTQWDMLTARNAGIFDWRCLSVTGIRIGVVTKKSSVILQPEDLNACGGLLSFGSNRSHGVAGAARKEKTNRKNSEDWQRIFDEVSYCCLKVDPDHRLEIRSWSSQACRQEERIAIRSFVVASAVAQEGDVVIALRNRSNDKWMQLYLLRPLGNSPLLYQTSGEKYRFLGPCVPFSITGPVKDEKGGGSDDENDINDTWVSRRLVRRCVIDQIYQMVNIMDDDQFDEFVLV